MRREGQIWEKPGLSQVWWNQNPLLCYLTQVLPCSGHIWWPQPGLASLARFAKTLSTRLGLSFGQMEETVS
jgi:hypothetical protein